MIGINLQTILLSCLPLILAQTTNETSIENATVASNNTTTITEATPATYEFVIKLVFGLEIEKVPDFLLQTIFDNPNGTATQDIISLYTLDTLNLSSTIDTLEKLGYDPYGILNIEGLEKFLTDFDLPFKDFYNAVLLENLNVSGLPLMNFLKALGINTGDFSSAFTYNEPDPLETFKKGNFSEDYLFNATQVIGKTTEDLFVACRNEIIAVVKRKTTEELFNILIKYKFGKPEAAKLWDILELSVENAENVTVFSDLLDDLKFTLENVSYLGVLTSNKVAINKHVHENIRDKMKLSKLFAQSLYDNTSTELKEEKPYYENIVTLRLEHENFTTSVNVATTTKDLEHCQFLTLDNDTLISRNVDKVNKTLQIHIEELNITDLIPGSPLICDNKVYGLAKQIQNNTVIFDTFAVPSGVQKLVFNPIIFIFCIVIYFKL